MKNSNMWKETKFVRSDSGVLTASRDPREVSIGSRLVADLTAEWYGITLSKFARGKLLDLGCGKAPLYGVYAPHVVEVVLADWASSLHENRFLDVVCDITKKLPFKDDEFDTIILSDVLEHIPNPQKLVKELRRVLRSDGVVLMNVPFMYWVHEAPYDYNRYTEFMLRKLVEDEKMQVVELQTLGGGWVVLIDLLSKLYNRHPRLVKIIQKIGPKILSKKLHERNELPISYAMVFKKGQK